MVALVKVFARLGVQPIKHLEGECARRITAVIRHLAAIGHQWVKTKERKMTTDKPRIRHQNNLLIYSP